MAYVPYGQRAKQVAPVSGGQDFKRLSSILEGMAVKYETAIAELMSFYDGEIDRSQLAAKADSVCLDILSDLTTLFRYRVGNPTDYYAKMVSGGMDYLKELRNTLQLLVSIEKLGV